MSTALTFLLTPLGLLVASLATAGGALLLFSGLGSRLLDAFRTNGLVKRFARLRDAILQALDDGKPKAAAEMLWRGVKAEFDRGIDSILSVLSGLKKRIGNAFEKISNAADRAMNAVQRVLQSFGIDAGIGELIGIVAMLAATLFTASTAFNLLGRGLSPIAAILATLGAVGTAVSGIFGGLAAVFGFLVSPLGVAAVAISAFAFTFLDLESIWKSVITAAKGFGKRMATTIRGVVKALKAGDWKSAAKMIGLSILNELGRLASGVKSLLQPVIDFVGGMVDGMKAMATPPRHAAGRYRLGHNREVAGTDHRRAGHARGHALRIEHRTGS